MGLGDRQGRMRLATSGERAANDVERLLEQGERPISILKELFQRGRVSPLPEAVRRRALARAEAVVASAWSSPSESRGRAKLSR